MNNDAVSDAEFDDTHIEALAQAIHANYLRDELAKGTSGHPAVQAWDSLPVNLKAQNRQQARENIERLAHLGIRVVVRTRGEGSVPFDLGPELLETLARDEHDRWCRQKRAQGYRWGPTRCDEGERKRHPDLMAWEDLSEDVREKDRAPMRRMVDVLAEAGLAAVPI